MARDPAEDEDRRLYAGPLSDFVARRNARRRALKQAGEHERSKVVGEMRKPTVTAWALNQVYWCDRPVLDAWLAGVDRERALQLDALGGGADMGALQAVGRDNREHRKAVVERALAHLEGGGHGTGAAVRQRLQRAVRSLALEPASRRVWGEGRLVSEVVEDDALEAVASEIDPAILLAALREKGAHATPKKPVRQVDSFLARNARARRGRERQAPSAEERQDPAPPEAEVRDAKRRVNRDKLLAQFDSLEKEVAERRAAVERAEAERQRLQSELEAARRHATSAKRALRDAEARTDKVRLELEQTR